MRIKIENFGDIQGNIVELDKKEQEKLTRLESNNYCASLLGRPIQTREEVLKELEIARKNKWIELDGLTTIIGNNYYKKKVMDIIEHFVRFYNRRLVDNKITIIGESLTLENRAEIDFIHGNENLENVIVTFEGPIFTIHFENNVYTITYTSKKSIDEQILNSSESLNDLSDTNASKDSKDIPLFSLNVKFFNLVEQNFDLEQQESIIHRIAYSHPYAVITTNSDYVLSLLDLYGQARKIYKNAVKWFGTEKDKLNNRPELLKIYKENGVRVEDYYTAIVRTLNKATNINVDLIISRGFNFYECTSVEPSNKFNMIKNLKTADNGCSIYNYLYKATKKINENYDYICNCEYELERLEHTDMSVMHKGNYEDFEKELNDGMLYIGADDAVETI